MCCDADTRQGDTVSSRPAASNLVKEIPLINQSIKYDIFYELISIIWDKSFPLIGPDFNMKNFIIYHSKKTETHIQSNLTLPNNTNTYLSGLLVCLAVECGVHMYVHYIKRYLGLMSVWLPLCVSDRLSDCVTDRGLLPYHMVSVLPCLGV